MQGRMTTDAAKFTPNITPYKNYVTTHSRDGSHLLSHHRENPQHSTGKELSGSKRKKR
jgi:hypothetical protein